MGCARPFRSQNSVFGNNRVKKELFQRYRPTGSAIRLRYAFFQFLTAILVKVSEKSAWAALIFNVGGFKPEVQRWQV